MSQLPRGTVTLLFTDIEGSTSLLEQLGEEYGGALDAHRRVLRGAFQAHGGREVDTQGDAFFVAFERARDAVAAAADGQRALASHRWPGGATLRVRMGIHTGEPALSGEGYVGADVHRAARISAAAHGGQVLLSQSARDLLDDHVEVSDLGEHRLKDLTRAQRLYQLVAPGLDADFPAPHTLERRPTNLPAQPTAFVGRQRELQDVCTCLRRADVRLLTLTGPGGTGKTRLALQAAADLLDEFADGAFFVPLAPLVDPDLVVGEIEQALSVNAAAGQTVQGYLAGKTLLLVLDNFEHVVAAGTAIAELLAALPELKVLVTSREPLHVAAEHVQPVPPLALPDLGHLPSGEALSQYEAVSLFVERAQAVRPGFEVTSENAPAVAEICVRLDGLPLAIELAAARTTLLTPEAMLVRLGQRLKLLRGGSRDLPARQQTLRDAIEWSYELLDENERRLFARLAVFAGGFTLERAEEICDADLDALASLVEKSLLRGEDGRLSMLETIREYALERFAASGEESEFRERHASHFLELAEKAYRERIEREPEWSSALEEEHDNLRAALSLLAEVDSERELALAGALGWFWHVHSHLTEGRERLERVLDRRDWPRDARFARAATGAGDLAAWQGDHTSAESHLRTAISLWRELGELAEAALALEALGWSLFFASQEKAALAGWEESLKLQREVGNPIRVVRGQIAVCQGLVGCNDVERAEPLAHELLTRAREHGDLRSEHLAHHFLGDCSLIAGDGDQAEQRYARSLKAAYELGDRIEAGYEIQGLAMSAACRSRLERALRLAAAADRQLEFYGVDYSGIRFWAALLERYLGRAREEVGAEKAAELAGEGRGLSLDQAVEYALDLGRD